MSVSDAQRLHPLSPGARAASPRNTCIVLCGTCASRMFHITHYIRRAPQARASEREGKQPDSMCILCHIDEDYMKSQAWRQKIIYPAHPEVTQSHQPFIHALD